VLPQRAAGDVGHALGLMDDAHQWLLRELGLDTLAEGTIYVTVPNYGKSLAYVVVDTRR
jgi:hypothetical protein